ncbi:hypothetical protein EWM64_g9766, partial [Hericium alpestre]
MTKCSPITLRPLVDFQHEGLAWSRIGSKVGVDPTNCSQAYKRWLRHPDFYYKTPRPGHPTSITPRFEHRAVHLITSGQCSDATDVQRELFPHLYPTVKN